jgi:hypothetical protein
MGLGGQVPFDRVELSGMILCLEDQPVQSIFSTRRHKDLSPSPRQLLGHAKSNAA